MIYLHNIDYFVGMFCVTGVFWLHECNPLLILNKMMDEPGRLAWFLVTDYLCLDIIFCGYSIELSNDASQNLIFRFLQSQQKIQIWLYDHTDLRIEGRLIGFDEYMNLVLDDAEEISVKRQSKKPLGRILLKGDNISLMTAAK